MFAIHRVIGFLRVFELLDFVLAVPYLLLDLCPFVLQLWTCTVVYPVLLGVLIHAQWAPCVIVCGTFRLTFVATVPVFVMQYSTDKRGLFDR